ncbi:BON domain-containing protein [Dyella sp. C9]|uniref:BON domain-containing protein n=1 Tax=Dyella sp. C9 TaxID=2202154 RepID=UPI001300A98E|nr:BON domain-containing protein [Dyella sp. C9]
MNARLAALFALAFASPVMAWQTGQQATGMAAHPVSAASALGPTNRSTMDDATRPNTPEDARLVTVIHQAIDRDPGLAGQTHDITPIVSEGAVVLRGDVSTEAGKARIDTIVRQLPGVTEVTDELDVKH